MVTKADQIRAMDDVEMANALCEMVWISGGCGSCMFRGPDGCRVMQYLKKEVVKDGQID